MQKNIAWSILSGGIDTVLCTGMFSSYLPRNARLLIKGDRGMLETLDGDSNVSARVMLASPEKPGTIAAMAHAGQFDSLIVVEEGEHNRHVYEAVICVIPEHQNLRTS